jgi:hypothetical protein
MNVFSVPHEKPMLRLTKAPSDLVLPDSAAGSLYRHIPALPPLFPSYLSRTLRVKGETHFDIYRTMFYIGAVFFNCVAEDPQPS